MIKDQLKLLETLLEHIPYGVYLYELEEPEEVSSLRLIATNSAATKFTGIKAEKIVGRKIFDAFPGLKGTKFPLSYFEALKTGRAINFGQVPYGDERISESIYEAKAVPLSEVCVAVIFENITQHKILQRALKQSERRYRDLVELSQELIWTVDTQGIITFINQSSQQFYGYEPSEIIGRHFSDMIMPESIDENLDLFHEVKLGRSISNWEAPVRHKDGRTVHVLCNINVQLDENGNACNLIGTSVDITERKNKERQLKREHALLSAMLEVAIDGILILDEEKKVISYNQRFAEIWGFPQDRLLSNDEMIGLVLPKLKHPAEFLSRIEKNLIDNLTTVRDELQLKDGRVFDRYSAPIISAEGTQYGRVIYIRDITERIRFERELSSARDRALEATRMKSEFLANVSHEIRTPMNGVLGMTSLLMRTELSAKQTKYAKSIEESAEALLNVINDILDFSKIEAGKLSLDIAEFDLSASIENCLSVFAGLIREKGLRARLNLPRRLPKVSGDEGRIRQVLVNLIGNAVKFTKEGRIEVDLSVIDQTEDSLSFRISISDTGPGIDPADYTKIFEPFSQLDGSVTREHDGTGLGLAISKQIVELMGGQIGIESKLSKGSTFWFTLHLRKEIRNDQEPLQEILSTNGSEARQRQKSILVAEDNPTNQELLREMLDILGFQADIVPTGVEAVEAVDRKSYDLIFMDCHMPQMDGYQATRLIRDKERVKSLHTPIIALTARAMVGDRERCLKAGMDDYLSKPMKVKDLESVLNRWTKN
jgi:PAS domain S-box-containing protein